MSATPTSALVEESEKMAVRALDGTASREEKSALFASLAATLRRAEAELDAATTQLAKKFKRLEELERRAEQAEAERDAQHEQVLRLTAEWDEARVQLRAANDFLRVVTLERDHAQQVEVPDAFWRLDEKQRKVAELTATRDLLTAENERLQQEHNAYCRKLANDGLTVAGRLQRELDAVRAENDTLHYLLRGGQ